ELVKLMHQTGLPKGVLNLVPGPGNIVGSEIITNKKVDKISFTGETSTGKMIGAQAGMEAKRVSLELGGKAPYVIFDDADVPAATSSRATSTTTATTWSPPSSTEWTTRPSSARRRSSARWWP